MSTETGLLPFLYKTRFATSLSPKFADNEKKSISQAAFILYKQMLMYVHVSDAAVTTKIHKVDAQTMY